MGGSFWVALGGSYIGAGDHIQASHIHKWALPGLTRHILNTQHISIHVYSSVVIWFGFLSVERAEMVAQKFFHKPGASSHLPIIIFMWRAFGSHALVIGAWESFIVFSDHVVLGVQQGSTMFLTSPLTPPN